MAWTIYIKPNQSESPRVTFDPNPLPAQGQQGPVLGEDLIWSNLDDEEHWPGLADPGTPEKPPDQWIVTNKEFFMKNKIGAKGSATPTSSTFTPQSGGNYYYKCSIEGHEDETGQFTYNS